MTAGGRVVVVGGSREKAAPALAALAAVGLDPGRLALLVPGGGLAGRPEELHRLVAGATGAVLLGGGDPDPAAYGEAPLPGAGLRLEPGRDELERRVFAAAREARVPTWGVCRGMQMLNVLLGGTLFQDLPIQAPSDVVHRLAEPKDALAHEVEVTAPDTPLGTVLGGRTCRVNSRHHQGVKDLAPGLVAVARAPDGLVEAYSLPGPWWLEAVQWHPENLLAIEGQRGVVARFAAAVAAREGEGA